MPDFNVEITASADAGKCRASATGQMIRKITEAEAALLGFGKKGSAEYEKIRKACGDIIGEAPDRWFLSNPTQPHPNPGDHKYDNSYTVFGWPEVAVNLRPIKAEFISVETEPVIATYVEWVNKTDTPAPYGAELSTTKAESVSHSVSENVSWGTGTTIGFKVGIEGAGDISGEQSFTFNKEWGKTDTVAKEITVGFSSHAQTDVPAHSTATCYLWSNLGSADFRITYEVSLTGLIMTLNDDWYNEHCYRGLDPGEVLEKAGLPPTVTINYDHIVGFYCNAKVELASGPYDPNHSAPSGLSTYPVLVGGPRHAPTA